MRYVLAILLVVVLLVLGTYYWFGLKTEKLYDKFVKFNESSGYTVTKEYHKGLFSSTATMRAVVGPPDKSYYIFVQTDRIEHGPFPISDVLKGKFDPSPVQAVIESQWRLEPGDIFGAMGGMIGSIVDVPPLGLDTIINIGGDGSSAISWPPFNVQLPGGFGLDWKGVEGEVKFDSTLARIEYTLRTPGMEANTDEVDLFMSGITVKGDMEKVFTGPDFYLSDSFVEFEKMRMIPKTEAVPGVSLSGLKIEVLSFLKETNIEVLYKFGLSSLDVNGKMYGPAEVESRLFNVDADGFRALIAELQQIGKINPDNQDALFTRMEKLKSFLAVLLKKSPGLEMNKLSVQTPEGEIKGTMRVQLVDAGPEVIETPELLLGALEAKAHFEAPKGFVVPIVTMFTKQKLSSAQNGAGAFSDEEIERMAKASIRETLNELTAENLIVIEDGLIKIDLVFTESRLTVNGNVIPLPIPGEAQ